MADVEEPQSGYRDLGGVPAAIVAPDLYQALGGQLTSLNEQLSGFQQELAGMSAQVPAPSIVPPNVSSPMGQVGSVLADLFSPMAGIKNPITAQQEAYRAQQMEGLKERRSILQQRLGISKEQAALVQAQAELEKHRQEQQDAPLKFVPGLLSIKTPAAMLMAGQLIERGLKSRGIEVPPGLTDVLISKQYDVKDINEISLAKMMKRPPEIVYPAYRYKMTPESFQAIWAAADQLPDDLKKAINPHFKTQVEQEKELTDLVLKTRELATKRYLEMFPGAGNISRTDAAIIDAFHARDNNGAGYINGTKESQARADTEWLKYKNEQKMDPAMKAAETTQARQGATNVMVDGGRGKWYDKQHNAYRLQLSGIERAEPGRWKALNQNDLKIVEQIDFANKQLDRLRNLIPKVFVKEPGANLARMLANKTNTYLGSNPDYREFTTLVYSLPFEQTRVLGGTAAVRQGLYQILQQHANVAPYDTQTQAKQMIDFLRWEFYNRNAVIHGMPQLHDGQRIGPGKFKAFPIDPATGGPNRAGRMGDGRPTTITLKPGEISDENIYLDGTVE